MAGPGDSGELREALRKRHDVVAALAARPRTKPELVEAVGRSRSTIDRAIGALEEVACVERVGGRYRLTQLGHVGFERHRRYVDTMDDLRAAGSVLNALPDGTTIDTAFLRGADVQEADPYVPESALRPSIDRLGTAKRVRCLAPVVLSVYVDLVEDLLSDREFRAEVVVHRSTLDGVSGVYSDRLDDLNAEGDLTVYVTDETIPYGLWVVEREGPMAAAITVYRDGGIVGVLMNDVADAVAWASEQYERYRGATDPLPADAIR